MDVVQRPIVKTYIFIITIVAIMAVSSYFDVQNAAKMDQTANATISNRHTWEDSDGDKHYDCDYTFGVNGALYKRSVSNKTTCDKDSVEIKYEKSNPGNSLVVGEDPSSTRSMIIAIVSSCLAWIIFPLTLLSEQKRANSNETPLANRLIIETNANNVSVYSAFFFILLLVLFYVFGNEYRIMSAPNLFLWMNSIVLLIMAIISIARNLVIRKVQKDDALMLELSRADKVIFNPWCNFYLLSDSLVLSGTSLRRIAYRDILHFEERNQSDEGGIMLTAIMIDGKKVNLPLVDKDTAQILKVQLLSKGIDERQVTK